jgi:hypothetical protein
MIPPISPQAGAAELPISILIADMDTVITTLGHGTAPFTGAAGATTLGGTAHGGIINHIIHGIIRHAIIIALIIIILIITDTPIDHIIIAHTDLLRHSVQQRELTQAGQAAT